VRKCGLFALKINKSIKISERDSKKTWLGYKSFRKNFGSTMIGLWFQTSINVTLSYTRDNKIIDFISCSL
jgi:hypothetical protein